MTEMRNDRLSMCDTVQIINSFIMHEGAQRWPAYNETIGHYKGRFHRRDGRLSRRRRRRPKKRKWLAQGNRIENIIFLFVNFFLSPV